MELLLFKKKKNPELERKMVDVFYSGTIAIGQKTPQWRTGHNSQCSTEDWGVRAKEQGGLSGWKIILRKHGVGEHVG